MPGEMEESSAGLIELVLQLPLNLAPAVLGWQDRENVLWLELVCWAQITAASPALSQDGLGPLVFPVPSPLGPCPGPDLDPAS